MVSGDADNFWWFDYDSKPLIYDNCGELFAVGTLDIIAATMTTNYPQHVFSSFRCIAL